MAGPGGIQELKERELRQDKFVLLIYGNYALTPGDELANKLLEIDNKHSEYSVDFDSGVCAETFALEIYWKPELKAGDTVFVQPPIEIEFLAVEDMEPANYEFRIPTVT